MTSLNETKASSSAITAALVESTNIHQKLQEEYNIYHELSVFASSLYFATKEFSKTNILYSLSVPAYIRLFLKSLPPLKVVFTIYLKTNNFFVYSRISTTIQDFSKKR